MRPILYDFKKALLGFSADLATAFFRKYGDSKLSSYHRVPTIYLKGELPVGPVKHIDIYFGDYLLEKNELEEVTAW